MSLSVGDIAPDFVLKNTEGEDVQLSLEAANQTIVLLFFPLAYSSVCTDEMCRVRDDIEKYKSINAKVIGISIDSFFTLKEFKEAKNLNYELLSDFNRTTVFAYGCLYDDFFGMKGVGKRAAFVVGKDMKIKYAEVLEDSSELPDFKAIQKAAR